jgi:hypothetical protein
MTLGGDAGMRMIENVVAHLPTGKPTSSKQRVARLAFWSIIIGAAVMGLKFVAGG